MNVELIRQVVTHLVDFPDQVHIEEQQGAERLTVLITVKAGDDGRLIGRGGRTINALRTILKAMNRSPRLLSVRISTCP